MVKCPTCGGEATYVQQYNRYYCYKCKQYLPQQVKAPQSTKTGQALKQASKETKMQNNIGVINSLKKGTKLLFKNPAFFVLAAIPLTAQVLATLLLQAGIGQLMQTVTNTLMTAVTTMNINTIISILMGPLIITIITYAVIALVLMPIVHIGLLFGSKMAITQGEVSLGPVLKQSFKKLGRYYLGIILLLLISLIPIAGIFITLIMSFLLQVLVIEDKGIGESVKHAWKLGVKNIGKLLVFGIIGLALLIASGLLLNLLSGLGNIGSIITSVITILILYPLFSLFNNVLYLEGINKEF
ncbi:hypothetical protein GF352_00615 [archaeon]|nr:hypothetical protein [archaeon]